MKNNKIKNIFIILLIVITIIICILLPKIYFKYYDKIELKNTKEKLNLDTLETKNISIEKQSEILKSEETKYLYFPSDNKTNYIEEINLIAKESNKIDKQLGHFIEKLSNYTYEEVDNYEEEKVFVSISNEEYFLLKILRFSTEDININIIMNSKTNKILYFYSNGIYIDNDNIKKQYQNYLQLKNDELITYKKEEKNLYFSVIETDVNYIENSINYTS